MPICETGPRSRPTVMTAVTVAAAALVLLLAVFLMDGKRAFAASFSAVNLNTSTPAVYDMLEITFNLNTVYANPFDPDEVDVKAYFASPSNKTYVMPGFYKSDSSPNWAVRYAPLETGAHTVYLEVTDGSGTTQTSTYTFTATAAGANRGFMGVQGNRFVDSYGSQLTLLGTNFAWSRPDFMLDAMETFEASKMNVMRLWLSTWWSWYAAEWGPTTRVNSLPEGDVSIEYEGIGRYQLENMERLDTIFQGAEDHNIYINLVLNSFGDFLYNWNEHAYNQANGGPSYWSSNNTDFWTNPTAIAYQKKLLRYLFARFGYSRALGLLEYWNESDNQVDTTAAIRDAWHAEVDSYWKSWDFYKRPTTTSFAWKSHSHQNHLSFEGLTTLDAVNLHRYGTGTDMIDIWEQEVKYMLNDFGNRPSYIAEYGRTGTDDSTYPDNARYFHDGVWAPVFRAGAAGAAMIWLFDQNTAPKSAFDPPQLYKDMYESMANFMQPEEKYLVHMPHVDYGLQPNDTKVGGFKSNYKALLWINDTQALYTNASPRTVSGMSLILPDMLPGTYDVLFHDTVAGTTLSTTTAVASGGALTIPSIPALQRDIAVKVSLQGSGDDDTVPPAAPTGLHSPAQTDLTVSLAWSAASDDVSVIGYRIYRDGELVGATSGATSLTVGQLTPGTAYNFTVIAFDTGFNESTAAALTASTLASPVEPSGNVLLNPFFEEDDGNGRAASWTCDNAGMCSLDSLVKKSGHYALKVSGTNGAWSGLHQTAAAEAGETYTLSGFVNVAQKTGAMTIEAQVRFLDAAGAVLANHLAGSFTEVTSGFTEVTGAYVAPANTADVQVQIYVKGMRGTFYLDEFVLVGPVDPGGENDNLLLNASFEEDNGAGKPLHWSYDKGWVFNLDSLVKQSGDYSLKASGTSGAWAQLDQTVPAVAGGTYDFTGYLRIASKTGDMFVDVRLQFLDSGGNVIVSHTAGTYADVTPDFIPISDSQVAPANTANVRVMVYIRWIRGDFYLDGFELAETI